MIKLRLDTIEEQNEKRPVDKDRQQIGFALAIRGEGKSELLEGIGDDEFQLGYTGLDLHAPPNMENAFWCIPNLDPDGSIRAIPDKKNRDERMKQEYKSFIKNRLRYIRKGKPTKITILCSESLVWAKDALDDFNDRRYTKEEFEKDHPDKIFNMIYPQMKPMSKWGKELIRFVKLPAVTKSEGSETNQKALELIIQAILDGRTQRRMVVLNRMAFGSENQYFWTMELIMRSLPQICDKHFGLKTYEDFGLENESQMKPFQKNWNRSFVIHRELSELAPAKLKADKSGESTPVKKSLLGFARVCRHWEIDWFADWQKNNDVESAIRSQADVWFFKKYSEDLGGDEKKGVFDTIAMVRKAILERGEYGKIAHQIANSFFPPLQKLAKKYFYTKFISGNVRLFKVPRLKHQHKEPYMKWSEITGIWLNHDKSLIPTDKGRLASKVAVNDQKAIFELIWMMRNPANKKPKGWIEVKDKLSVMQKSGELEYPKKISEMSNDSLRMTYNRLEKKFNAPITVKKK